MNANSFEIIGLGGKKGLSGKVSISGAKNSVLKLMAASLLNKGKTTITNIPDNEDVLRMIEIISDLKGVSVKRSKDTATIDASKLNGFKLKEDVAKRLRASVVLTGPVLARVGKVSFPHPGGCVIGSRPIDLFIDGFEKMGAKVKFDQKAYTVEAKSGLKGAKIFFKTQSVTATETFMIAASLANGQTILSNVAMEPEIIDLGELLKKFGIKITGLGTPTITIEGQKEIAISAVEHKTVPDRIEAGSFLILGALAAKKLVIENCQPKHLEIVIEYLKAIGTKIIVKEDSIEVEGAKKLLPSNIKTHEYPGFPTDLQAPMAVLLTQALGDSLIFETIFEGRLNYIDDLVKMGANLTLWDAHRVQVKGPSPLKGRELEGPDIRTGFAFLIAAIIAEGQSKISNVYYIDRGYEKIEEKLQSIGVSIKRVN